MDEELYTDVTLLADLSLNSDGGTPASVNDGTITTKIRRQFRTATKRASPFNTGPLILFF